MTGDQRPLHRQLPRERQHGVGDWLGHPHFRRELAGRSVPDLPGAGPRQSHNVCHLFEPSRVWCVPPFLGRCALNAGRLSSCRRFYPLQLEEPFRHGDGSHAPLSEQLIPIAGITWLRSTPMLSYASPALFWQG